MVWDEAAIAVKRINRNTRTNATLMYRVTCAAFGGGKESVDELNKLLEKFNDGREDL